MFWRHLGTVFQLQKKKKKEKSVMSAFGLRFKNNAASQAWAARVGLERPLLSAPWPCRTSRSKVWARDRRLVMKKHFGARSPRSVFTSAAFEWHFHPSSPLIGSSAHVPPHSEHLHLLATPSYKHTHACIYLSIYIYTYTSIYSYIYLYMFLSISRYRYI